MEGRRRGRGKASDQPPAEDIRPRDAPQGERDERSDESAREGDDEQGADGEGCHCLALLSVVRLTERCAGLDRRWHQAFPVVVGPCQARTSTTSSARCL